MMEFVLYTREGCHLCDSMLARLSQLQEHKSFTLKLVDIDRDQQLRQKYNELVPILLLNENIICKYFIDEDKVLKALN